MTAQDFLCKAACAEYPNSKTTQLAVSSFDPLALMFLLGNSVRIESIRTKLPSGSAFFHQGDFALQMTNCQPYSILSADVILARPRLNVLCSNGRGGSHGK